MFLKVSPDSKWEINIILSKSILYYILKQLMLKEELKNFVFVYENTNI